MCCVSITKFLKADALGFVGRVHVAFVLRMNPILGHAKCILRNFCCARVRLHLLHGDCKDAL